MGDKEKGCVKQVVTVLISVIGLACSSFLYGYPPHITHAVH